MADGLHSKRLSLDTNVLLDLAAGHQFAVDFKEEFQRRKYALQVVPGVMAEVAGVLQHRSPTNKLPQPWELPAQDAQRAVSEDKGGCKKYNALLKADEKHPTEKTGAKLLALMPRRAASADGAARTRRRCRGLSRDAAWRGCGRRQARP